MALTLSRTDKEFLDYHEIPLSQVFDARSRPVSHCKDTMAELNAIIAVNTTACQQGGHRMRTRAGHCVMCHPAKIAYMRRHEQTGFVYIAVSKKGKLVKVGSSTDIESREKGLNSNAYGRQRDWEIRHYRKCERAGQYEFLVQKELAPFSSPGDYYKEGHWQDCYELFSCNEQQALEVFNRLVPKALSLKP